MALMEETIGKYDWELLDLTYDSTFLTRTYDQYCQMVRYKNDTAVVEIRGINNGIYADYYFALIDKKMVSGNALRSIILSHSNSSITYLQN